MLKKFVSFCKKEYKETCVLLKSVPALFLTLFVLSVVLMNLLANKCIIELPWVAFDAGFFISWISFLTMDVMVKRFGPKAANKISFVAIAINLVVAGIFMIIANIPGSWGASYDFADSASINSALDATIGSTWYVLLGSTLALICGALTNNGLNAFIGLFFKRNPNSFKAYATRSYISTSLGQFVDNLVFAGIVSYNFFGWTLLQCLMCSAAGMLFELIAEIIFSPIGYRISRSWEKDNVGQEYFEYVRGNNE